VNTSASNSGSSSWNRSPEAGATRARRHGGRGPARWRSCLHPAASAAPRDRRRP
jgi:hypothetical protein